MSRILLIEDDASFRLLLSTALVREGHTVDVAENGMQALPIFKAESPDLVMTDLLMPEKDGIETILEIRKLNPTTRIIAMSGGGRENAETYLRLARSLGAKVILSKPFDLESLRQAIAEALT